MTPENLRQAQLAENCILRRARKAHRCIGADEFRSFWAVRRCDHGDWQGESKSRSATRAQAEAYLEKIKDRPCHGERGGLVTGTEIEPDPNPEYNPDCLVDIHPGDTYVEYVGEKTAFWESGSRYCASCAAEWVVNPA